MQQSEFWRLSLKQMHIKIQVQTLYLVKAQTKQDLEKQSVTPVEQQRGSAPDRWKWELQVGSYREHERQINKCLTK